jgi:hypothetical protein
MKMRNLLKICNNQDGIAIIIVLFILATLTITSLMASRTSTTELQISTSDQIYKISFYAAEDAQAYVIFNTDLYGSANIDPTDPVNFPEDDIPTATQVVVTDSLQSFNGQIAYLNSMVPPRGSGYQVGKFKSHVYQANCSGHGPRNSTTRVEIGFYRIGF